MIYYIFNNNNKLISIEQGSIMDQTAQKQQALTNIQNSLHRQNMQMFQNSQPKKIIICNPRQIGCY